MTRTESAKLHEAIAQYIERHPEQTFQQIADKLSVSLPSISVIANRYNLSRRDKRTKPFDPAKVWAKISEDPTL